jgi:hypothetical protein
MKHPMPPPEEARLRAVLRESRPTPDLPPGFQNAVWRRIERAGSPRQGLSLAAWLDHAADWILQPRLALAGAAAMLLIGLSIGLMQGASQANDLAKQRYLAAVSPASTP